jgi:hypothetical protein
MIAPALAKRGYRVSMICYDYGQPDGIEQSGVTIFNMHKPDEGIPVVRYLHPRLTSLWRALGRADADIYYQRTAAAYTGFVSAFCRKHGRKAIYAGARVRSSRVATRRRRVPRTTAPATCCGSRACGRRNARSSPSRSRGAFPSTGSS